eukprot:Pgem_evm1s19323
MVKCECGKRALYNVPGAPPLYCGKCKTEDSINVTDKRCKSGCGKYPNFNYPEESRATYCSNCKLIGMIDVRHKRCKGGCGKFPNSNYPGQKVRLYCVNCKLPGMVDVNIRKRNSKLKKTSTAAVKTEEQIKYDWDNPQTTNDNTANTKNTNKLTISGANHSENYDYYDSNSHHGDIINNVCNTTNDYYNNVDIIAYSDDDSNSNSNLNPILNRNLLVIK